MNEVTYYKRNRETVLNRAKEYYKNSRERLKVQTRNKEKNIKRDYGRNRYHNMSEDEKQKLKEYQKNYREANKNKMS